MKSKLVFSLIILGLTMTSCSKSYECTCYDDQTGATVSTTTIKAKGSVEATVDCTGRTTSTTTCYLN